MSNLSHPVGVLPLPELQAPWRLVRSLDRGGIGEVFEATHPSRGRAAVKVLLAAHQGRSDLVDQMRLKGEILGELCHPNIVELYEVGAITDGRPFVAMEYLTGSSLLAELDRRPWLRPGVRQPVRGGRQATARSSSSPVTGASTVVTVDLSSLIGAAAQAGVQHAEYFLSRLDRLPRSEVDLALELYRDPELLRAVRNAAALPEQVERVAISIDHTVEGPFLMVTRGSHFVTCLGRGMRVGSLPVVTRADVDAISWKVAQLREKMALAQQLGGERGHASSEPRWGSRLRSCRMPA